MIGNLLKAFQRKDKKRGHNDAAMTDDAEYTHTVKELFLHYFDERPMYQDTEWLQALA